jgi:hypothetical protein
MAPLIILYLALTSV